MFDRSYQLYKHKGGFGLDIPMVLNASQDGNQPYLGYLFIDTILGKGTDRER